jgi:hypothetical protein
MICFVPLFALAAVGAASAHEPGHGHHLSCSFDTEYDVQVNADGIAFTHAGGQPADVFMHDGALRVDGRELAVSPADAARLRDYEQQVRDLVPAIAGIARDGVEVGYSALTAVVATLSDNGEQRTRLLQSLHDRHAQALRHVDSTLGRGVWKADDQGDYFAGDVRDAAADLVGSVTGDLVKDALSDDPVRLAALQARADALDTTIDKAVDGPAQKLGERAEALCPRFARLQQLQQQWALRLPGGARLQLISPDTDRADKASYARR